MSSSMSRRSFSSVLSPSIAALVTVIVATCCVAHGQSTSAPANKGHVAGGYNSLPLRFEENRGQVSSSVRFVAHGQGYGILLEPSAATFALHREAAGDAGRKQKAGTPGEVIRMGLVGADAKAAMSSDEKLPGYVNYIRGSDQSKWKTNIPTYARTRVSSAYPGVDVVYYGTQRRLEYDFIVSPAATPEIIRLSLSGASPAIAADGSLRLQAGKTSSATDLRFEKPVVYQTIDGHRQPVEGAFRVAANGEVGFTIGTYDHSRDLVIDPIISYGSYFGGTGEDEINGSALNAVGQLYAVGQTYSIDVPKTTGEFQPTDIPNTTYAAGGNGHDGFVTKFSADGTAVLWTTYLGGSLETRMNAVAAGASDNAYVTGVTSSTGVSYYSSGAGYTIIDYPVTSNAFQSISCPGGDGYADGTSTKEVSSNCPTSFVTELSSDGKSLVYSTFLGSDRGYDDQGLAIAVDASGNIYVAGHTYATDYKQCAISNCQSYPQSTYPVGGYAAPFGTTDFPTTANAYSPAYGYAKSQAMALGPDQYGDYQFTNYEMAFLSVFNAAGNLTYSTTIGGGKTGSQSTGLGIQQATTVAPGKNGIVYVGGVTTSVQFPTTTGAFQGTCTPYSDQCYQQGWLAAFDTTKSGTASLAFSTYINGTIDGANAGGTPILPSSSVTTLTTDSSGNVVVAGTTNACNYPTTAGTIGAASKPHGDGNGDTNVCAIEGIITKFTPAGATVWSTYLEGTGNGTGNGTIPNGITLDAAGDVYVLATADDSTLPLKNPIYQGTGATDGYLIEISPTATQVLMGTFIGTSGGGPSILDNNSLHLDGNATAYLSGSATCGGYGCGTIPVTTGAFQTSSAGGNDGFVMKIITQQQPSATTLTVSPSTGTATPSQTVTLTANLTTSSTIVGSLLPGGTVTFLNGNATIGTGTISASGVATYSGMLAAGTYSITASYPGNSGFNGSVSTASALTVNSAATTTTTLAVTPATSTYGTSETLTATVNAGTTAATAGSVTFTAGSVVLGTATVTAGTASITVKPTVGIYAVVATYTGTYNQTSNPTGYGNSTSVTAALTITKAATTTTQSTSAANANLGASFTLTATVPTGATGTVSFYNGTTLLGMGTVGTGGTATLATTISTAGSYNITSVYSGDTNFTGSTSTALVEVVKTPTAVTASSSTTSTGTGSSFTLTSTLPTGATGTVSFYNGTTLLGTATVGANGVATLTTSVATAGTYSVSATYSGDGNYYGSTTTSIVTITVVTPSFTVTATPANLTISRGSTGTITLTATPVGGYTGSLTFTCGMLPSKATCSFSPATVTIGATAVTDTLTIGTGSAMAAVTTPKLFEMHNAVYAALLIGLFGLARRRKLTKSAGLLLCLLCLAGLGALSGCSSDNLNTNETPSGTYSIVVTGAGTTGSSQAVSVAVVVQ